MPHVGRFLDPDRADSTKMSCHTGNSRGRRRHHPGLNGQTSAISGTPTRTTMTDSGRPRRQ